MGVKVGRRKHGFGVEPHRSIGSVGVNSSESLGVAEDLSFRWLRLRLLGQRATLELWEIAWLSLAHALSGFLASLNSFFIFSKMGVVVPTLLTSHGVHCAPHT